MYRTPVVAVVAWTIAVACLAVPGGVAPVHVAVASAPSVLFAAHAPSVAPADPAAVAPPTPSVVRTLWPNYNASVAGEFPYSLRNFTVGTPAIVPPTGTVWLPERPVAPVPSGVNASAPAVVYNLSTNTFEGVVPALTNASALLYDPANGLVYAAEWSADVVQAFDPVSEAPSGPPIAVGSHPAALGLDSANGYLFVANSGSNNLTVVNSLTGRVVDASVPVGKTPFGLAVDPTDGWVYVASSNASSLTRVNATTPTDSPTSIGLAQGAASGISFCSKADEIGVTVAASAYLTLVAAATGYVLPSVNVGTGNIPIASGAGGSQFVIGNYSGASVEFADAVPPYTVAAVASVPGNPAQLVTGLSSGQIIEWSASARMIVLLNNTTGLTESSSTPLGAFTGIETFSSGSDSLWTTSSATLSSESIGPISATSEVAPVSLPSIPTSITSSPSGALYVAGYGDVEMLQSSTGVLEARNTLLPGPNGPILVVPGSGLLWVGRPNASEFVGLNLTTLQVQVTVTGVHPNATDPQSIVLDTARSAVVYLSSDAKSVGAFAATNGSILLTPIHAGSNDSAIAYDPTSGVVYVVGDSLTALSASNLTLIGAGFPLSPHSLPAGAAWDPSRATLFVSLASASNATGLIDAFPNIGIPSSRSEVTVFPDGIAPRMLAFAQLPGSNGADTGVVFSVDPATGAIGVIGSPPTVGGFQVAPNPADVNQTLSIRVSVDGGAGPSSVSYTGLPPGCAGAVGTAIACTPSFAGHYNVTAVVRDAYGDVARASLELNVSSALQIAPEFGVADLGGADVGVPAPFNVSVSGGTPGYGFKWTFGDGSVVSGANLTHVYGTPGIYDASIDVTDATGAVASGDRAVSVQPDPTVQPGTNGTGRTVDVGMEVELVANVSGGTGIGTATWAFPGEPSASGREVAHEWSATGVYPVGVTYVDALGVAATGSVSIVVNPALQVSFAASTGGGTAAPGQSIAFSASATGGTPPYNVTWVFGSGSFAYGEAVSHAFTSAGAYTVSVRIADGAGAMEEGNLSIAVAASAPPSSSLLSGNFGPGLVTGLIVGGTIAAVVLFSAERTRRRRLPGPPSPYVPPPSSTGKRRP